MAWCGHVPRHLRQLRRRPEVRKPGCRSEGSSGSASTSSSPSARGAGDGRHGPGEARRAAGRRRARSFSDNRVRDNLVGCTVGTMDNLAGAFANALDMLLDQPEQLAAAAAAPQAGEDELVLGTCWRRCASIRWRRCSFASRATRRPSPRARTAREVIPRHARVRFERLGDDGRRPGRPSRWNSTSAAPHHHLHFGVGMHQCLGAQLASVQLTEFAKALVRREHLRRAPGDERPADLHRRAFPNPFVLEFDP